MSDTSLAMRDDEDDYLWQQRVDPLVQERVASMRINRMAQSIIDAEGLEPIRYITLGELRRRPAMTWLADRFVAKDTVAALSGPAGTGKSFVAIDLACSVATGQPFLRDRPTRPGNVLYIAGEGAIGLPQRILAWEQDRGVQVPDDRITVVEAGVNLSVEMSVDDLVTNTKARKFDLVIVDTFSTLSGVVSENDSANVADAIKGLVRVRQANPGCAGLIIHHTGKDSSRGARGSSAFPANVDTLWILDGTAEAFSLSTESSVGGKQKDAPRETIRGLGLTTSGESSVVTTGGVDLHRDPDEDRLRALGQPGDEFTTKDAVEALGESQRTVERALQNLTKTGRVERIGRGQYRISDPANQFRQDVFAGDGGNDSNPPTSA